MAYLSEIFAAWRPILAATLGMGTGMSIAGTVTSAIAPTLVADVGWAKAQFAMIGTLGVLTAIAMPFIGRLADVIGVRFTAAIGLVCMPLTFVGFSLCGGSFALFAVFYVIQTFVCVTTTATVYSRLAVQHVVHARGLALAIIACGPAVFSAVGGPLLNGYVEANGWEAAYRAMALLVTVTGIVTFLLIPPERAGAAQADEQAAQKAPAPIRRRARDDYPVIFRSPPFWILLGAMLLCNLPLTLVLVQLKMLVLDNGVSGEDAAVMFTTLAVGMLLGRFLTGVALDRLPPHIVSFVTMVLPAVGLFILASPNDTMGIVTFSIFCLGFAVGAEGDVLAFLVARYFRTTIYSSVLGLLTAATALSNGAGALYLSWTLARTGTFDQFLVTAGTGVLVGSSLLLLLGRREREARAMAPA
ncbi:MFS transporter [Novosphingobium mangrovi (ex Huang et al. 2023)]|uniref:MFS transporter n=1 Tax=Novosphingobium mangrovi (ex Huang et al. 2023) TaxID=2976432 RepID=A0ABT2I6L5_9SPHN|nr:MFS transporter [Novosphingobium mangrovi (ex Huang et al. 2023)]MCT2400197.1 MFS transporter [Novosphingobium mangrovi (ex Huang et al. 2023)]